MKRTAIVTDLTRFAKQSIVCIAAIDRTSGACLRPLPYLQTSFCEERGILPGTIISGDFVPRLGLSGPHREDCNHSNLVCVGNCSTTEFLAALTGSLFPSIEEGFNIKLPVGQKHIPTGHSIGHSIITVELSPSAITVVEDRYNPGKIKLNFSDSSGRVFSYIPITDLGFHNYAVDHHSRGDLAELNAFLRSQQHAYLRIGLSRSHEAPDGRHGYWLQANGIYTFPDYMKEIRSYS